MVENNPPAAGRKAVSGVKSCQMNKKKKNIFNNGRLGDNVSPDILPRYTWDRWL